MIFSERYLQMHYKRYLLMFRCRCIKKINGINIPFIMLSYKTRRTYLADGGEAALAGLQAGHGPPVVGRVERLVVVHDLQCDPVIK